VPKRRIQETTMAKTNTTTKTTTKTSRSDRSPQAAVRDGAPDRGIPACCDAGTQTHCCEPSAKATCCGPARDAGCGCQERAEAQS
jgi:hypothetical protein